MDSIDNFVEIREIEPRIAQYVADKKMYILRDVHTGIGVGVSPTEEGLKFCGNSLGGKTFYYRNGIFKRVVDVRKSIEKGETVFSHIEIVSSDGKPLEKNPRYRVELFVPRNHKTKRAQVAECMWVDKAYRLSHLNASPFEA